MNKKERKYVFLLLLCLLSIICMIGCGKQTTEQESTSAAIGSPEASNAPSQNDETYAQRIETAAELLRELTETYRLHWQEKLLAEGKIRSADEICDVTTMNITEYNFYPAVIQDGDPLRIYVITMDPDRRFHFYQSAITLNEKYEITDSKDLAFEGLRSQTDIHDWCEIDYSRPWQPDQRASEQGELPWYCVRSIAEITGNYAKENDAAFYQALTEPVSAAEAFLQLGEGSGEYLPLTLDAGYVVYTLADGTEIYLETMREDRIWYPVYIADLNTIDATKAYLDTRRYIRNAYEQVTAKELRPITEKCDPYQDREWETNFCLLADFPEEDAAFYCLNDFNMCREGMVLRVGDNIYPIYLPWYECPDFHAADYDQDGVREFAFQALLSHGTGFHVDGLYICDPVDGELRIREFEYRDYMEALEARVSCNASSTGWLVTVDNEEQPALLDNFEQYLLENDLVCSRFVWDDIVLFTEKDGIWTLEVHAGAMIDGRAVPQYENTFCLSSPVIYHTDGSFELGELRAWKEEDRN